MPETSPWIVEINEERFEQDVVERSKQIPVVVDFWAEWCQPCRLLGPVLEKLAAEYDGKFLLAKADTEKLPGIAAAFGVQSIPAVFALSDGKLVDAFVGVLPEEEIRAWLDRILPSPAQLLVAEAAELEAGDLRQAEAKYREALELSPTEASARIGLARVLLAQDRLEESRAQLDELEKRGFLEPEAENLKAELHLRLQAKEAGSVEQCRAAAAADPKDLTLRLKLAEALAASGQYEEALEICLKLVQADKHGVGQKAKQVMVDVFHLLGGESVLASAYRRKLAAALY